MFSRILMLLLLAPVQTVCASEGDGADDDLRKIVEQQGREIERLKHRLNQAQSAPPGKRKAELNEAVDEYLDDTDQGAVRGVAAGWSSDPNLAGRRVRIGGYFSIEYRDDGDGNNGEFDLHRLVIKIQADIAKAISFDTEIEIEGGGADVDFLTDNEILVEYAELRFELWESYMDAADVAHQQGHYAEAEKQFAAALDEAERFAPEDSRLSTSLYSLAEVYRVQGRYAAAEPLYMRALAIDAKALGTEHPDVATVLNNLALLYDAEGKYTEAEPLYQRSLAIWEKALGRDHPHVAQSLENYATLLRETGRDAEATKMEARAASIRTKHSEQNPAN